MCTEVNFLFTSVGRRVELVRSFQRAYRQLGVRGKIVVCDVERLAPGMQVGDVARLLPRVDDEAFVAELAKILKEEEISVLFPLIDPEIPVLASHRDVLERCGTRLAVVSPDASRIVGDKWETHSFFDRLGLLVPRSWLPGQRDPAVDEYPLFIKPRCGSAAEHVFPVKNAEELSFFSRYVPQPIVQEYLSGPEITSDVICDWDGRLLSIVSRQRIRVRGGEVLIGKTVFDEEILHACAEIAHRLPALGPITVQCIMHSGRPVFTEINARLGGGAPVAVASGADFPCWLLARAAGIPMRIPPLGTYCTDLYFSRFDESFFFAEGGVNGMGSRGV